MIRVSNKIGDLTKYFTFIIMFVTHLQSELDRRKIVSQLLKGSRQNVVTPGILRFTNFCKHLSGGDICLNVFENC